MKSSYAFILLWSLILLSGLACNAVTELTNAPTQIPTIPATRTSLPHLPVQPGEANPDEPVFITGDIPYTSPFFLETISAPFVLLEDQAGFIQRDKEFVFPRSDRRSDQ